MNRVLLFLLLITPFLSCKTTAQSKNSGPQPFGLVTANQVATVYYDATDEKLIERSARLFAEDVERVTGKAAKTVTSLAGLKGNVVIIGTLGKSKIIDQLAAKHKEFHQIKGSWERYVIKTINKPFPGVDKALVIAGSDRRGTAFGVFSLSEEIGVSPWYWWADAPGQQHDELILNKETVVSASPSVKYRGIFLNDEAPALRGWAEETFGGFNHEFYEKIFELLLRNKANYLWPAMWQPSAFAADDPENARLADEYGIVISTSHHEPMMRAHDEWGREDRGPWNYEKNKKNLRKFWRGGIERMGDHESVVTVGMRGDGDEAMSEGTAVDLLQTIIADQREIIADVTGKPAEVTPQVWAIYKEVQDYYDKGMRVDEDILVLLCDDNWGNIRILPKKEDLESGRKYGIYYHFDFVGGPVSYRWQNVTQIERVWEQMSLAYDWGVKELWLVNVGDLKPMELPISFFLDLAWDTEGMEASDLPDYYVNWARQQFGPEYAEETGKILASYTKFSARRTPEMLAPDTYSLTNYQEADRILAEYRSLLERSQAIYDRMPASHQAAFYQLVLSPVAMLANLNEMYVAAAKNKLHGDQTRASTNYYADKVKEHFEKDAALARYFHDTLAGGKWNHIMEQTHIGYTSWNNPPVNKMPAVSYIQPRSESVLGYTVENGVPGRRWGPPPVDKGLSAGSFTTFDPANDQRYYVEVFNGGSAPLFYTVSAKEPWIKLSANSGTVTFDEKVYVSIDWDKVPAGTAAGEIVLAGAGREYTIKVPVRNDLAGAAGFVENNGVVSIEAPHFTQQVGAAGINWTVVPNMGRTGSAVTVAPANAGRQTPGPSAPRLEYTFTLLEGADLEIGTYLSPTLNYQKNEGLKFAIAIDDEAPQIINLHEGETQPDWEYPDWWNKSVTDHIKIKTSMHKGIAAGRHTLKVWMVDPGVVFQKFVLDAGGLQPSYLGPPESAFLKE